VRRADTLPPPPTGLTSWRSVARHALDLIGQHRPGSGMPALPRSIAETAMFDRVAQEPSRGSSASTLFVVEPEQHPYTAMYDCGGLPLRGRNIARPVKTFKAARQKAAEQGGAWIYRIEPDAAQKTNPIRRGKANANEIVGAIYVYGASDGGAAMPIAIPNVDALAWNGAAPHGTAGFDATTGRPLPPTAARHTDILVERHRPGSPEPAAQPSAGDKATYDDVMKERGPKERARFVLSTVPPDQAFDGTGRPDGKLFRFAKDAVEAVRKRGEDTWLYRIEPAATRLQRVRSGGKAARYEVVGGVHVYADGTVMPIAIPNERAVRWTAGTPRQHNWRYVAAVGTSFATGAAILGEGVWMLHDTVPENTKNILTLAVAFSAIRGLVKVARYAPSLVWQKRYQRIRELGDKQVFETALNELEGLIKNRVNLLKLDVLGLPPEAQTLAEFRDAVHSLRGFDPGTSHLRSPKTRLNAMADELEKLVVELSPERRGDAKTDAYALKHSLGESRALLLTALESMAGLPDRTASTATQTTLARFDALISQLKRFDGSTARWRSMERELRMKLNRLDEAARAMGIDPTEIQAQVNAMRETLAGKASYDKALRHYDRFIERLTSGERRLMTWFEGIPKADREELVDAVGTLRRAIELLCDDKPDNDPEALASLKAGWAKLNVAPQFRPAGSPVRWVIDIVTAATYMGALAYALRNHGTGILEPSIVMLFSVAYAADGVRMIGIRAADFARICLIDEGRFRPGLGKRFPIFSRPDEQTPVADGFLFNKLLSIADETATQIGAAFLMFKVGFDWYKEWGVYAIDVKSKVVDHSWRYPKPPPGGTVRFDKGDLITDTVTKPFYFFTTAYQFKDSLNRRFDPPDWEHGTARTRFLDGKIWAGVGSLALVAGSLVKAEAPDAVPWTWEEVGGGVLWVAHGVGGSLLLVAHGIAEAAVVSHLGG
jgi:hypothetical protein